MSEIFLESQEPGYDILDFAALKVEWPEGNCAVRGHSSDCEILTGQVMFTHDLPMPPVILAPATVPEP